MSGPRGGVEGKAGARERGKARMLARWPCCNGGGRCRDLLKFSVKTLSHLATEVKWGNLYSCGSPGHRILWLAWARTWGMHGLGQYTKHTQKFIASKFVSCSETSYNKHRHVLLNICVQFHNYQHPLRISLLKTCSEGTQFFIKCTFYSHDTFCKVPLNMPFF
jgi:hypothetical protein